MWFTCASRRGPSVRPEVPRSCFLDWFVSPRDPCGGLSSRFGIYPLNSAMSSKLTSNDPHCSHKIILYPTLPWGLTCDDFDTLTEGASISQKIWAVVGFNIHHVKLPCHRLPLISKSFLQPARHNFSSCPVNLEPWVPTLDGKNVEKKPSPC